MSSNSVCNHTRDKQIGLPLRDRPILLSLVRLQTEVDSTQAYYHYLLLLLKSYLVPCALCLVPAKIQSLIQVGRSPLIQLLKEGRIE